MEILIGYNNRDWNIKVAIVISALVFFAWLNARPSAAEYSQLWGRDGELWKPNGRLPNFSKAGYHKGDKALPNPIRSMDLKQLGAKGDGGTDDTVVFKKAMTKGGVIYIPEGKYKLTEQIIISQDHTILRGAGREETILYFDNNLESVLGRNYWSEGYSAYSFGRGFIEAHQRNEIGLENLTIMFPSTLYAGHHKEKGYNAVDFLGSKNCWLRNVKIANADFAVKLDDSQFCTAMNIKVTGNFFRRWWTGGHYGISLAGAQYCLVTDFRFDVEYLHDLSISNRSLGNVFSNGSGRNLNFDHHGHQHLPNLFSNIDVGKGNRVFESSGKSRIKKHDLGTYWNIRTKNGKAAIECGPNWGRLNIIGARPGCRDKGRDTWIEPLTSSEIAPQDLHVSMVTRRQQGLLPNQKPIAVAGPDRFFVVDSLYVLDGLKSRDPDGDNLEYNWNFGDGKSGSGVSTVQNYSHKGVYTARLTVADQHGAENSDTATVTVISDPNRPVNENLVGYWPFDDGAGSIAIDHSDYGHHGRLIDMDVSSAWLNGRIGGALAFDGINDYVDIGNPKALNSLSKFTYAAWIHPISWGKNNDSAILSKAEWKKVWRLMNEREEGTLRAFVGTIGNHAESNAVKGSIELEKWQHVALTYNDGGDRQIHLFVNGYEIHYADRRESVGSLVHDSSGILRIGGYDGLNRWFHGYIDDLRIYSRVLSQKEIKSLSQE